MSLEQCPHCRVPITEREIELNECDACFQSIVLFSPFNPFEANFSPEVYDMNETDYYLPANLPIIKKNDVDTNTNFIPKDLD